MFFLKVREIIKNGVFVDLSTLVEVQAFFYKKSTIFMVGKMCWRDYLCCILKDRLNFIT